MKKFTQKYSRKRLKPINKHIIALAAVQPDSSVGILEESAIDDNTCETVVVITHGMQENFTYPYYEPGGTWSYDIVETMRRLAKQTNDPKEIEVVEDIIKTYQLDQF